MTKILLFLFAVFFGVSPMMAQEHSLVTIHRLSGNDLQVAISSLGKLTFDGDAVCLISKSDEVLACEPRCNMKSISFVDAEIVEAVSNLQNNNFQITVFPNPTVDIIHIQGLEAPATLRIFDLQGKICKTFFIKDTESTCNIADVPQGVYYLQINTNILKLIKQ